MNYYDRIDNSVVIDRFLIKKKYVGIASTRKRIISIGWFIITALYTIFTKFIFKDFDFFDIMTILTIGNLLTVCLLVFISKTIFEKEHFIIYRFIFYLNQLIKILIFISGVTISLEYFYQIYKNTQEPMTDYLWIIDFLQNDGLSVILNHPAEGFTLAVQLVLAIPSIIHFVIFYILAMPPICIIIYIRWLLKDPRIFYEYDPEDEERIWCYTRMINIKSYGFKMFVKKVIVTALLLALIILGIYFVINR